MQRRGDEWTRGMYMHGITGPVPHLRNRSRAWPCRGLAAPAVGHVDLSALSDQHQDSEGHPLA